MMKILKSIGCVLLVCTLSACSHTLTHAKPYSAYVQRPLTLQRDMDLNDSKRGVMTFWSQGNHLKSGTLFFMTETSGERGGGYSVQDYYATVVVKAGAPLTISRIYSFNTDGGYELRVYGKIYAEALGKDVPFFYEWPVDVNYQGVSEAEHYKPRPAPWE